MGNDQGTAGSRRGERGIPILHCDWFHLAASCRFRRRGATLFSCFALLAAGAVLTGCGKADVASGNGEQAAKPTPVGVVTVTPTSVPIVTELAGRITAYETSEVRPQVSGVIRRRSFTQGSIVREGQTLFRIDAAPYEASAGEARANLQSARANLKAAQYRAERYKPLADMEAISKQDYTDAVAQARQAAAAVAQAEAALRSARIALEYTTVPAPISGRIGRSFATVGALVTENQTEPLAVIQRLDPVYVDIRQSSGDLLALRRVLASDDSMPTTSQVRLTLGDGQDYGRSGTVDFTEAMVDESTGTVTLRATFPNPDGLLLPGMFVRARLAQAVERDAFLVPQQGLSRDPKGEATVMLVGTGNQVESRKVKAARTQGAFWIVTSGLEPGDTVVVQGLGKIRPGQSVKPVPAATPQILSSDRRAPDGEDGDG